jgi:hypothetical protein
MIDQFRIKKRIKRTDPGSMDRKLLSAAFPPQVYFIPYEKGKHIICLGLGPSFTMGYYLSKYNNDFEDFYIGVNFNTSCSACLNWE